MTIAFRADASLDIGIGHIMRCLTLAEALRARGANCHFICREHPGHLLDQIRKHGFSATALPSCEPGDHRQAETVTLQPAHAHWLGCDWQTDAQQTGEILASLKPDWLVVDHYALDARWEDALRAHYGKLLVIDDLADRPHTCDLLLDQNLGREAVDYANLVPEQCTVLAGPRFAQLRPEFSALREYSLRRRKSPAMKHLLIAMGGVDRPNATGKVLEALKTCPLPVDCKITVVMGGQAPWLEQVREIASTMPWPTEVRVDISDMAQVMADSDLAIGAAGSTSWERCCLGLPTLLVVIADNQKSAAFHMSQNGITRTLLVDQTLNTQLQQCVSQAVDQPDWLIDLSSKAASVTDGGGCELVINAMMHSARP